MGNCLTNEDDLKERIKANQDIPRKEKKLTQEMPRKEKNLSLELPIQENKRSATERACFGAGCFWGTEKFFRHSFTEKYPNPGRIIGGKVGFMGPDSAPANPTYLHEGDTGHVEVYDFEYVGGAAYYEELVKYFFQFHDPTTFNRQGNDHGPRFASVIYCYTEEQFEIAYKVKERLQQLLNRGELNVYNGRLVGTHIRRSTQFYPAHEEHQNYLTENPEGYCNHRLRFIDWPSSH